MKKSVLVAALAVAVVFGVAAYATADIATYALPGNTQSGTVNVTASVNPKITLTITTPDPAQSVAFGALDGGATASKDVTLLVDSNKAFDLVKVVTDPASAALMGFSTSLADQADVVKGEDIPFTDTYSVTVPFTTDPGTYTTGVQYTVTQNP